MVITILCLYLEVSGKTSLYTCVDDQCASLVAYYVLHNDFQITFCLPVTILFYYELKSSQRFQIFRIIGREIGSSCHIVIVNAIKVKD